MSDIQHFSKFDEAEQLIRLKEVLLHKELQELDELKKFVHQKNKLSEKVDPLIDDKIDQLKSNFKSELGSQVDEIIADKLRYSQEELVNILTPYFGKLINQFIKLRIKELQESIKEQINQKFSIVKLLKSKLKGVKYEDEVLNNILQGEIVEVFVIQRHSGLLFAQASKKHSIDRDVVAGMFTAIKSFVEDAFDQKNKELELIEYQDNNILIHSLEYFFFVFVVSGDLSMKDRTDCQEKMFDFIQLHSKILSKKDVEENQQLSNDLFTFFFK